MPRVRNFMLDNKNALLQYIMDLAETWPPHDIHGLFDHAQRHFKPAQHTTWAGKSFWQKLSAEEGLWERECKDGQRRRGHEKGSEYDVLMAKFTKLWSKMTAAEWQSWLDNNQCKWDDVPEEFKQGSEQAHGFRVYVREYPDAKLQQVVTSAASRAREVGKPDLAMAVIQIHKDSMENEELRDLLEKILTQKANTHENSRFQEFVRDAKRKIKAQQGKKVGDKIDKRKQPSQKDNSCHPSATAAATATATTTSPAATSKKPPAPSRQPSSPEEITYDPPDCACSNCRGGKEWQDNKDTAQAKKQPDETEKEFVRQTEVGPSSQNHLPEQDDDATLVGDSTGLDVDASNPDLESPATATDSARPISDQASNVDSHASTPLTDPDITTQSQTAVQPDNNQDWSSRPTAPPVANMFRIQPEHEETVYHENRDATQIDNAETRRPHADPLVTKILGDLQYEPAVQELLQHETPLPSEANVRTLKARESALEVMRNVLEEVPAARTDLRIFMEKLEEIEDMGRREEAEESRESSARKQQTKKKPSSARKHKEVGSNAGEDEYEEVEHDSHQPQAQPIKKRLRVRSSTSNTGTAYDRKHNRWPCPMAKETGCTTLFSKAGHAVRHARAVHEGKKDFNCPDCGKLFARHDNMNQHRRGVHKNGKGMRESRSSTEEAEEADLEEARRAHKRRRIVRCDSTASWDSGRNAVMADGGSDAVESSRETSPLTEFTSEDEEQAKEAYVEEQLRITTNSEAIEAIEAEYGPMSPTEAGGDDDAMTAVPDMAMIEDDIDLPPPPPPPPFPEEGSGDPLRIISAATAAAVAQDPGIARLEAKIDSLLHQRANRTPRIKESSSSRDSPMLSQAPVSAKSPTEALASIADILQSGALDGQSPEVTQLLMRMARDAADATIYAGEAMRRAGEVTKNLTMVLEKISENQEMQRPQQREEMTILTMPM